MTILPLRRLFIERQAQPEMLTFVSTEEVKELFNMYALSSTGSSVFVITSIQIFHSFECR